MPVALGGKGDFRLVFKDDPYPAPIPYMKEYYQMSIGYHFGELMIHIAGTHQNDFIEMGLHHVVTIFLIGGSYLANY